MSLDLAGPASIQARMASIQTRFGQLVGPAAVQPAPAAGAAAQQASFADTLASFTSAAEIASATGPRTATAFAARLESTAAVSSSGGVSGERLVVEAMRYLGVPYKWGGTDPATGLDCSGLIQKVYRDLGIDLPRVSRDQAHAGRPVASMAQAQPGDLLAFGSPVDHIGIYAGDGKMVVAPKAGDVVKVQDVYSTPSSIRRILPEVGFPPGAATFGVSALQTARTARIGEAPAAYQRLFVTAGARYGVSPDLLSAVARAESGFNRDARSPVGALGLMQIMPATARGLGVDPLDPIQAVDGAARLLAQHLAKYNGSVPLALAAYNAGPGAVAKYGGIPPYFETQAYVKKILTYLGGAA